MKSLNKYFLFTTLCFSFAPMTFALPEIFDNAIKSPASGNELTSMPFSQRSSHELFQRIANHRNNLIDNTTLAQEKIARSLLSNDEALQYISAIEDIRNADILFDAVVEKAEYTAEKILNSNQGFKLQIDRLKAKLRSQQKENSKKYTKLILDKGDLAQIKSTTSQNKPKQLTILFPSIDGSLIVNLHGTPLAACKAAGYNSYIKYNSGVVDYNILNKATQGSASVNRITASGDFKTKHLVEATENVLTSLTCYDNRDEMLEKIIADALKNPIQLEIENPEISDNDRNDIKDNTKIPQSSRQNPTANPES